MAIPRRIISILVSLTIFLAVLLGTNGYQYFKIKNDIAENVIKAVNESGQKSILTFFESIEAKLNMVRDWGKNGVLNIKSVQDLNRQFIPLIEHETRFSGLVMADETGREYFLSQQDKEYLVRETLPDGTTHYQLWADAETPGKAWQEKSEYDPVNRPWFKPDQGLTSINWTKPYTFYHTQEEGITASVAWENPGPQPGYTVLGIDVLLSSLQQLLLETAKDSPVNIFLVNSRNSTFLAGSITSEAVRPEEESPLSTVLTSAIAQWNTANRPAKSLIAVNNNRERWLVSLQPLSDHRDSIWVGVAATEQALLSSLNKNLYSIDITDIMVALVTGLVLLGYLWKTGALRPTNNSVPAPIVRLSQYINTGEGAGIEFKSSVRMNLKTGNSGKEIELAWLKAIVGFLNTGGGVLLIGVDDEGRIVGLEADDFENSDRCLLHVKNLIHQHIGAEFSAFIETTMVESEGRHVVMLECQAAPDPVFLRVGKNEEYYIRSGPSSTKLSPSQMISYVLQKKS